MTTADSTQGYWLAYRWMLEQLAEAAEVASYDCHDDNDDPCWTCWLHVLLREAALLDMNDPVLQRVSTEIRLDGPPEPIHDALDTLFAIWSHRDIVRPRQMLEEWIVLMLANQAPSTSTGGES